MKQFNYVITSGKPAPAGDGDMVSWFQFYKWDVGGDAYITFPTDCFASEADFPQPGDRLWFAMDGRCLGYVEVLRSEPYPLKDWVEVFYNTDHIVRAPTMGHGLPKLNAVNGPVHYMANDMLDDLRDRIDLARRTQGARTGG